MKTTNYIVMTGDGIALCNGVSEYEIERVAQAWADRLAETVYYTESSIAPDDEDIVIAVKPRIGALLKKRAMVNHAFSVFIREDSTKEKEKVSRRVFLERAAERQIDLLRKPCTCTAELLNALRPFANIAADAALMADVLRGMRPHEAASLREALGTARLLVENSRAPEDGK